MALDRTWYNSLIDDSGSGIDGSVWDKADVNSLMNAIDAEIARLDGRLTSGFFTPTLVGASGTPVYTTQSGRYTRNDKQMGVYGSITISSKGSLSGVLKIGGLPVAASAAFQHAGVSIGYFSGLAINVCSIGAYVNGGTPECALIYLPPAGSTGAGLLDAAHLGAGAVQFLFGGTYKID